ncbi:hypothetical protein F4604DRAFT_1773484 [Suillus subluteus]|nr:hypothetical protein F4604DRAFT_1773484 [Suillus subluteus]
MEPTLAIPFHSPKMTGQQLLDVILPRHPEKFSGSVKMGAELRSFEQSDESVTAILAKNWHISETFDTKWIMGADGATGGMRELAFLGEYRDNTRVVTRDIRLKGVGLDRVHWHRLDTLIHKGVLSLRPTDEVGEDGWQFFLYGHELDITKIAQSQELITFSKAVWMSDSQANIRMVNKFSEGRVLIAGDAAQYAYL